MFNRVEIKQKAKAQLGNRIFSSNWLFALLASLIVPALIGLVSWTGIGTILVTGPLTYGLTYLYLKQARDGEQMNLVDLFKGFRDDFGGTIILQVLEAIFVFLWSLLFVIPGIVKAYSYSMIFYIKADHPDYDWRQCFAESKHITRGHKWDLFVLDISFIGWMLIGSFCFGIGTLWVNAYMSAAKAQAYEAIKCGE